MPQIAFQVALARVQNAQPLSGAGYGAATEIIYQNPASGTKYIQSVNLVDTNLAAAGDEVEVRLQRTGADTNNTTATNATAVLLVLTIPILNST